MPPLDDTVEEVLDGFDGTETYEEAEYALRDYSAKEISVNAAKLAVAGGGGGEAALDWQDVSWQNSWANIGAPYGDVQYAKDAAKGLLYFRGVANPAAEAVVFNLPAGFRPATQRLAWAFSDSSIGGMDVKANGDVEVFASGDTSFVFDGIVVSL